MKSKERTSSTKGSKRFQFEMNEAQEKRLLGSVPEHHNFRSHMVQALAVYARLHELGVFNGSARLGIRKETDEDWREIEFVLLG